MENNIPPALQSSVDSSKMSTSISGTLQFIGGIIVMVAVWKGADPMLIQSQVGAVIAQIATAVPAGYATWYAADALYGTLRKLLVKVSTPATVVTPPAPVAPTA